MPTQYIVRRSGALPARSTPGASVIYVDSDDNLLKLIPAGSGSTEIVIGTANASLAPTVATVLTAAQSGTSVMLNAAAGFAITLPAVAAGLRFRFTVGTAFATTNYTIITPALADLINGGAIVNSVYVPGVAEDTISFVATAETVGDFVELVSDGTGWFVNGVGALAGSITFTTAG